MVEDSVDEPTTAKFLYVLKKSLLLEIIHSILTSLGKHA